MKKLVCLFLAFVLGAGMTFAQTARVAPKNIPVGGSTSVSPLMELLVAEYTKTVQNVKFTISATGSGDGIKGVPAGTCEIGMSSRELTPAEKGTDITEVIIAIDGIAVIVNKANPISGLTTDQIKDIYTGKITQWQQLGSAVARGKKGKIAVISREPGSGTRGAFEELLKFQDQQVKGAREFDGTGAIKAEVSRNADAIGYISLGSVDATIKALAVNNVEPTTSNVKAGTYKIARPFILMHKKSGKLDAQTKAFLDWVLGPAGQAIVSKSWISVK